MTEDKKNYRALPQANQWLNSLEGVLRIVELDENVNSVREEYGLRKGIFVYLKSHIQVIEVNKNKVFLTEFGKKLLDLYNQGKLDEALKTVIKQSFALNDIYQLFLDFLDKEKGRRFSVITMANLSAEFHNYCERKGLKYKANTNDISFYVLYNTFLNANLLIKRYFEKTRKIDLQLNLRHLQNLGLIEKPRDLTKWALIRFADELINSFNAFTKKTKIMSDITNEKMDSVNYKLLRKDVIIRLNRAYQTHSPTEPEKVYDSLFYELMNKNPLLIEIRKLVKETKVIVHSNSKNQFNLW